jgi:hypothetical protein
MQYLEPIEPWEHHVEQDQIKATFQRSRETSSPIMGRFNAKAMLREKVTHQAAKLRIVIDEQKFRTGSRPILGHRIHRHAPEFQLNLRRAVAVAKDSSRCPIW